MYAKINELNIQKCRCNYFLEQKNSICYCGLKFEDHCDEAIDNSQRFKIDKWDPSEEDLVTKDDDLTDAYGKVNFKNNINQTSNYIRVSHRTDLRNIISCLFKKKVWGLKPPKLIISITGGADLTNLSSSQIDVICNGVVKVASTTDGWITTGGTYAGIMKYVGRAVKEEAVKKDKLVLLGIANWTSVKRRKDLIRRDGDDDDDEPVTYHIDEHEIKDNSIKEQYLDPNHSHFLLVDNAQLNKFGGEIPFRANFEAFMSKGANFTKPIPVVLVVIEGGPNTIKCVLESLKSNIPCVIIDKTGRFSDIFAYVYRKICEPDESFQTLSSRKALSLQQQSLQNDETQFNLGEPLRSEVRQMIVENFKGKNDQEILNDIEKIFDDKYRHLISYFELSSNKNANDLDEAILRAFIKSNETYYMAELCLAWNRVDIAKNYIFNANFDQDINIYENIMFRAILKRRIEFIYLLLENNFKLDLFLTYDCLLELYNEIPSQQFFKTILKKRYGQSMITFPMIGKFVSSLFENIFVHKYQKSPFIDYQQKSPLNNIIFNTVYAVNRANNEPRKLKTHSEEKFENPEQELFLFNLLFGSFEISYIFWRQGKNQVSSALMAVKLMRSLAMLCDEDRNDLIKISNEYENLACEALKYSYSMNELNTHKMLLRRVDDLFGMNCLQLAMSADCYDFVSLTACQNLLSKIWYNRISRFTPKWRIYLSMVIPLVGPCMLKFTGNKTTQAQIENVNLDKMKTRENKNEDRANTEVRQYSPEYLTKTIQSINIKKRQKRIKCERYYRLRIFDEKAVHNYFEKLYLLMDTPFVKFFHSMLFYLLFMMLFTWVLLCNFFPATNYYMSAEGYPTAISIQEIILIIWVITFTFEEARQAYTNYSLTFKGKVHNFLKNSNNRIDMFLIFVFYIGMILRFIPDYNCYLAARIFLSIDIIFCFVRFLSGYSFLKTLGPKLVMIKKMTKQLGLFFLLIFVFLFAYGICLQSILNYNQPFGTSLMRNVFYFGLMVIGGDLYYRDDVYHADQSCSLAKNDSSGCYDYAGSQVALPIMVLYILINLLLITLLIAIFSKTYEEVQGQADNLWKFQRHALISEYFFKPMLPAPLVLIFFAKTFAKIFVKFSIARLFSDEKIINNETIYFLYRICTLKTPGIFYYFKNELEKQRIIKWETHITDEAIMIVEKAKKDTDFYKLQKNLEMINQVERKCLKLIEYQSDTKKKLNLVETNLVDVLEPVAGIRMSALKNVQQRKDSRESKNSKNSAELAVKDSERSENRVNNSSLGATARADSISTSKSHSSQQEIELYSNNWLIVSDSYNPINYTDPSVLTDLKADIDLMSYPIQFRPKFDYNKYDKKYQIDRTSLVIYHVENGLPYNPFGRTGTCGRGKLPYWGPNYAIQALFTRWKKDNDQDQQTNNDKPVFEVLLTLNLNTDKLSLPSYMITQNLNHSDDDVVRKVAKKTFGPETYTKHKQTLIKIIKDGELIDKYIPESELSTDNAWIEFSVVVYHDDFFNQVSFKKKESSEYKWMQVDRKLLEKLDKKSSKCVEKAAILKKARIE